jgi:hypothetical protein
MGIRVTAGSRRLYRFRLRQGNPEDSAIDIEEFSGRNEKKRMFVRALTDPKEKSRILFSGRFPGTRGGDEQERRALGAGRAFVRCRRNPGSGSAAAADSSRAGPARRPGQPRQAGLAAPDPGSADPESFHAGDSGSDRPGSSSKYRKAFSSEDSRHRVRLHVFIEPPGPAHDIIAQASGFFWRSPRFEP